MKRVSVGLSIFSILVAVSISFAENSDSGELAAVAAAPAVPTASPTTELLGIKFKQSGFVGLEGGEIVQGTLDPTHSTIGTSLSGDVKKSWMQRLLFQYVNDIAATDRIRIVLAIECQLGFHYPYDQTTEYDFHQPAFTFYPDRAEGIYSLGDLSRPWLQFGFGYFPFRTNPDVRNLGEYLFRTNTYPVVVMNNFNRPYSRLLGFRISSTLFDSLHQDLLLTSSNLLPPLVDYSLSYVVSYRLLKSFDFGGAISFCHLIYPMNYLENSKDYQYKTQSGLTQNYSFQGTKPMLRFAIDPKPFFGGQRLFSQADLRLYGEWCVTAWEDQANYDTSAGATHYYDNRDDRTLYMLGLNTPIFRLLQLATFNVIKENPDDVFSFEIEHFPNKYPNSSFNVNGTTGLWAPIPISAPTNSALVGPNVFPWFWSFYFKKTFLDHFAIIAQLARDHMRPYSTLLKYAYNEDILERQGDWWWNIRLNVAY